MSYTSRSGHGSQAPTNSVAIGSFQPHPGTEAASEVYSTVVNANNQTIIGGAFSTYTDGTTTHTVNGLARLNFDGSLDTTFNSGSGVNVNPGGQYIRSVALETNNELVIGGSFTSYGGTQRQNVALVNTNGALDMSFNSAGGANGAVYIASGADGRQNLIGAASPARYTRRRSHTGRVEAHIQRAVGVDQGDILPLSTTVRGKAARSQAHCSFPARRTGYTGRPD